MGSLELLWGASMSVGGDMRVATNLTLRPGSDGNQLMQPKKTAGGGDPSRRRMQMMMMGGYTSLLLTLRSPFISPHADDDEQVHELATYSAAAWTCSSR